MTLDVDNHGQAAEPSSVLHTGPYDPSGSEPPAGPEDREQPDEKSGPSTVAYRAVAPEMRSHRYVATEFHARGGMGEVWLATDHQIGRRVALKKIRRERQGEQERFLAEAQIQGQLEHPGIVPVHDLGKDKEGQPFYIMKFVHGHTLKEAIGEYHAPGQESATPREVQQLRLLQTFVNLCQTVAYAHSRDVIHRDLKPDNVMLGPYGETLVLDWGLAKVRGTPEHQNDPAYVHLSYSGGSTDTDAGAVMGASPYMAPEVAEGKAAAADERTDVYLLGGTLYEILTGKAPRQGSSRSEIIELARTVPPVPPRQRKRDVPAALEAICLRAMALRKQDRYPTALALAEDVQRYLAGETVSAYRETFLERAGRWARRHRKLVVRSMAAVVVLGLALFGVAKVRQADQDRKLALQETDRLGQRERARRDVKKFRRLAAETHFYAVGGSTVGELAPSSDGRKAESIGRAALKLAEPWGAELENLPLAKERAPLKQELYDLLLLLAQFKSRQDPGHKTAREMLALLARARPLREPSHAYFHLRAQGYQLQGDDKRAAADRRRAKDAPFTALDHFLRGEDHLAGAARLATVQPDPTQLKTDRARLAQIVHRAVAEFRLALRRDAGHYWSRFNLGICYMSLGQNAAAVAELDFCVVLRPDYPWGYSTRGLARAALKRFAAAKEDLNRVIRKHPEFLPARLYRGVVSWQQGKSSQALADFTAVREAATGKQRMEAAYYRGRIHLERGEYPQALQDFNQVVREDPAFRPVYLYRARIYFARGEGAEGLNDLTQFLTLGGQPRLDPKGAEACEQRGRLLQGYLPKWKLPARATRQTLVLAVGELKKAIKLGGPSARRLDNLGLLYANLSRRQEAVGEYTKVLKLEPANVRVLNKRGMLYLELRQQGKSRDDFAKVIQHDPKNAEAHSLLGYIRACLNAPADALRHGALAQLNAKGRFDYLVLHNVACIYAELSRSDKQRQTEYEDAALALLRRAVALWKHHGGRDSGENEVELIRNESAFPAALKARKEFKKLIGR